MNRDTAQAIWYRRLDRNCFTSETPPTTNTAAAEQHTEASPAPAGRWAPSFTATSAAEEWRPLAEERRRWAIERG